MMSSLMWLLDEKQEESGASDLRPAIEAIGDQYLTINRTEARYGTAEHMLPLHSCPTLAYGSIEFARAFRADFYPGKWCDWTELRSCKCSPRFGRAPLRRSQLRAQICLCSISAKQSARACRSHALSRRA